MGHRGEPSTGCWNFAAYVQCGGGSPIVRLGDRDDALLFNDDTTDSPIGPADVEGGEGDEGDEGDDVIDPRDGAGGDKLGECGTGTETVQGDTGNLVAGCEKVTRPTGRPRRRQRRARHPARVRPRARRPAQRLAPVRQERRPPRAEAPRPRQGPHADHQRRRGGHGDDQGRALRITARDAAGNAVTRKQRLRK